MTLVQRKIRTEHHVLPEEVIKHSQLHESYSSFRLIKYKNIFREVKNIYPIVRQVYEDLDPAVQNCVDCYTSDWVVVNRKYQQYSTSLRVVDTRDTIGRYQTGFSDYLLYTQ